eukprot:scaffold57416_cov80-Attheya_sp.AAC.3
MKRMVALFTYREPNTRAVSHIHQICNRNPDRRSKEVLDICARCSYDTDPHFFNQFHDVVKLYEQVLTNQTFLSLGEDVDFLALDNADITPFLKGLKDTLPVKYEDRFNLPNVKVNAEKRGTCDFGMTSGMMRDAYSLDSKVYRNITLGRVGAWV